EQAKPESAEPAEVLRPPLGDDRENLTKTENPEGDENRFRPVRGDASGEQRQRAEAEPLQRRASARLSRGPPRLERERRDERQAEGEAAVQVRPQRHDRK